MCLARFLLGRAAQIEGEEEEGKEEEGREGEREGRVG